MSSAGRPAVLDRPAGETAGAARRPPGQDAGGPLWMQAVPPAGLFAGLIFAALPEISWYGQDARSFAMVTALATTATYLLVRVLGAGGSRRGWLSAYGLALTCLGLVNIFGLTLIPAHGLTVALSLRRAKGGRPDGSSPDGSRLGGSGPGG